MQIQKDSKNTSVGQVQWVTLENNQGFKLELCSYGASIYKIIYTNTDGFDQLLTLTNESIEDFLTSPAYFGKTVGRVFGRLHGPNYQIFDKTYKVNLEENQTSMLHGGKKGFSFQNYALINEDITNNAAKVTFSYESPDGEEGFPGNLVTYVSYELNNDNQIIIEYYALSDQHTLLNLTNHAYFNLSPTFETIDSHEVMVNANEYIEFDEEFRFKGIKRVDNSIFDLRIKKSPSALSNALKTTKQKGIDHIFLVNDDSNFVAQLEHPQSEVGLNVYSTYPSVVIYTHQYPTHKKLLRIDDDGAYKGITFECINQPVGNFSSENNPSILKKDEPYQESIVFQFYRKD